MPVSIESARQQVVWMLGGSKRWIPLQCMLLCMHVYAIVWCTLTAAPPFSSPCRGPSFTPLFYLPRLRTYRAHIELISWTHILNPSISIGFRKYSDTCCPPRRCTTKSRRSDAGEAFDLNNGTPRKRSHPAGTILTDPNSDYPDWL